MDAKIVIIIFLVRFSQAMIVKDEVDPVNRAISDLVKHQDQPNIDIITFGTQTFDELISTVTSAHKSSITFRIMKANENQDWKLRLNQSSLLLFDSLEVYKQFADKFDYCNPQVSAQRRNVVYFPKINFESFKTISIGSFCMFRATFVIDSENSEWIYQYKFDYYIYGKCSQVLLEIMNMFSRSQLQWKNQTFFTENMKNFNNCSMSVLTLESYTKLTNITEKEKPYMTVLVVFLQQSLNFTPVYDNFTKGIDLTTWQAFEIGNSFEVSKRFIFAEVKIIIAKEEIESPFLKFVRPYEREVWIYLGCSICIGLLTIQVVLRFNRQVQSFVFGRNVTTPTLNMWLIFNGIGMITLPSRNFARFLLTLYIIFCLIMRVGYQAKLYEFLQQDFHLNEINTIDDLIKRNFTFFVENAAMESFSEVFGM